MKGSSLRDTQPGSAESKAWEAVECRVYMGDGGISLHNVPNGIERARLIAAAPDLLEACKAQHRALDWLMARLIELDPEFRPSKANLWPAVKSGHAAIAKATSANSVGTSAASEPQSPEPHTSGAAE